MDASTLDLIVTQHLPPDFVSWLGQLWPLLVVGVLLGVLAWLISIVVYTAVRMLDKMI